MFNLSRKAVINMPKNNMTYAIVDREAGNHITTADTHEEAEKIISEFEKEDKNNGCFVEDFYEIVER